MAMLTQYDTTATLVVRRVAEVFFFLLSPFSSPSRLQNAVFFLVVVSPPCRLVVSWNLEENSSFQLLSRHD